MKNNFLKPLAESVWYASIFVITMIWILMYATTKIKIHYLNIREDNKKESPFSDVTLITASAVSQQGNKCSIKNAFLSSTKSDVYLSSVFRCLRSVRDFDVQNHFSFFVHLGHACLSVLLGEYSRIFVSWAATFHYKCLPVGRQSFGIWDWRYRIHDWSFWGKFFYKIKKKITRKERSQFVVTDFGFRLPQILGWGTFMKKKFLHRKRNRKRCFIQLRKGLRKLKKVDSLFIWILLQLTESFRWLLL